jgi:hypothetical protein
MWIMKNIVGLLASVVLLTGFAAKDDDPINGMWLGYYKSDLLKEKLIVKFSSEDHIEFYTGGFGEQPRFNGSYKLVGDSITFTYTTPDGQTCTMQGHISLRRNYVDGTWKLNGVAQGSFFMEKQDVEEKVVQRSRKNLPSLITSTTL